MNLMWWWSGTASPTQFFLFCPLPFQICQLPQCYQNRSIYTSTSMFHDPFNQSPCSSPFKTHSVLQCTVAQQWAFHECNEILIVYFCTLTRAFVNFIPKSSLAIFIYNTSFLWCNKHDDNYSFSLW